MTQISASFTCHVLPGAAFVATSGANEGDTLGAVEDLVPGDTYRLDPDAQACLLSVTDGGDGAGRVLGAGGSPHAIAEGSEVGVPGATLRLSARLTLLAPEGHKVDILLVAMDQEETPLVLPLEPLEPGRDHTLIGVDLSPGAVPLTDVSAPAFVRGTRVTRADGQQVPVETLVSGDALLTRDGGPQRLRAVLHRRLRAVGPHAPVVIPAGTLGNDGDLILGQHQRLFIYQRGSDRLTETAEMLIKAHHLVDGSRIFLRPGGFIDTYALVFDNHEVLYAECLPVESLQVTPETLPIAADDALAALDHRPHVGTEADRATAQTARTRLLDRDT